jgi:hypothetical protein
MVHRAGNVLYLPKDKVTRLTLCLLGTLEQECLPGISKFTPAKGCEVLTSNCACYRWGYSYANEPNTTDHSVRVRPDSRSQQCAVVTISPFSDKEPKLRTAHFLSLNWQIATYKNVLPPLLEHAVERAYFRLHRSYSFFYYRSLVTSMVCPESPRALIGIDTNCAHEHIIPYAFVSRPTIDFEDSYGVSIHFIIFFTLFALVGLIGYVLAHRRHTYAPYTEAAMFSSREPLYHASSNAMWLATAPNVDSRYDYIADPPPVY